VSNPFDTLRDTLRNQADAAKMGDLSITDFVRGFADAVKRQRVPSESCEFGIREGDDWTPGKTMRSQQSAGEYQRFDLRISVSDKEGGHLDHIHLSFLAKLNGPYHGVLHSQELRAHPTEMTASVTFADKEAVRYDQALQVFDSAIRHITRSLPA
jgi:hypothetical protein